MQRELRRLANRAAEYQQRNRRSRGHTKCSILRRYSFQKLGIEYLPRRITKIHAASLPPQIHQPDHQQHIANAGGDKSLDRGLTRRDLLCVGVVPVIPEANQQVGRQTHYFPGHKQQQQVAGQQHQQHGRRE